MEIKNLKQLEQLMKVCRRQGVRNMKIAGFEFTLENDLPEKASKTKQIDIPEQQFTGITADSEIKTPDAPTIDQLIDWSTGANGIPNSVPRPEAN